ncbi:hypothetical protein SAMN04487948_101397 [Halogranum amylolyticum]|uniref:Uncharacterized protein n=1 Tax=Halogranum amylolyticum TaxID=660520 RepID=A0A1H8N989_9EURY|nr:hypothetical protein SAMN04487948_101397 [Halogranum amylolyticum]
MYVSVGATSACAPGREQWGPVSMTAGLRAGRDGDGRLVGGLANRVATDVRA